MIEPAHRRAIGTCRSRVAAANRKAIAAFAFIACALVVLSVATPVAADVRIESVLGRQAPDFRLDSLDGDTISLDSYRGRPVVLFFFQNGCPASTTTADRLIEARTLALAAAADDADGAIGDAPAVDIVAISLDVSRRDLEPEALAKSFFSDSWGAPANVHVCLATADVRTDYGRLLDSEGKPLASTPVVLAVDALGAVRYAASGQTAVASLAEGIGEALRGPAAGVND